MSIRITCAFPLRETLPCLIGCLGLLLFPGIHARGEPTASLSEGPQEVEIHPTSRIRVRSFARETTPIVNPVRWIQFKYRIPEGSRVEKGEVVFDVDLAKRRQDVAERRVRLAEEQLKAERRGRELDRTMQNLVNAKENLQDTMRIQEARLAYLKSLPTEEDVSIAQGKLGMEETRLAAEEENLTTMQDRFKRNMISEVMVLDARFARDQQLARTRHARQMLRSARLPASKSELEIVRLRIENLKLEIQKTEFEIQTQKTLHAIQREGLKRSIAERVAEIEERAEELQYAQLTAPRGGVILYTSKFKQILAEGNQPAKGLRLAEIPHQDSIAYEGELPERVRHLFTEGDPVEIRLNQAPNLVIPGRLLSISPFSRDTDEEENTGVKVLDVVLEADKLPESPAIGVYGWATIRAKKPRRGYAVPLSWIRYREGKPHASVEGTYQPVTGIVHREWFQFSSPMPAPELLQADGKWPEREEAFELQSDRFHASGELTPVDRLTVSVPRVRTWRLNVADLYPENTMAEAGDLIVKLDSDRIRDRAKDAEADLRSAEEEAESAEEELALRLREQEFAVKSAENDLRIRELERNLKIASVSASELYSRELSLTQAELALNKIQAELERLNQHPELTAPSEIARVRRDVVRRKLQLERSRIQYKQTREGLLEEERSQAELQVLRQATQTVKTRAQNFRRVSRAQSGLRWRKRRLRREIEDRNERQQDLKDMEIHAQESGLVKYEKVWDGVKRTKLKLGMEVYRGMTLLSLSNTGDVFVEVPVPERYVRRLRNGMNVTVRIPAEGNRIWKGTVTRLGQLLEPSDQVAVADTPYADREPTLQQVLPVRVRITPEDGLQLNPGAIAHVIFPFDA